MVKSNPNEESSSPPGGSSAVVAEIRASLFRATTVLCSEDAAQDGYHASTTMAETAMLSPTNKNSASSSVAAIHSPSGGLTSTAAIATASSFNAATIPHVQLECGRLKYSHVKGEWILRHNPIHFQTTTGGEDDSKNAKGPPVLMPMEGNSRWIANIHAVVSTDDNTADTKPQSSTPMKRVGGQGLKRKRSDSDEDLGPNLNGEKYFDETENNKAKGIPALAQPSPALVQCLLRGAEFISMMEEAKSVVLEKSACEAVCWSRVRQGTVPLRSTLVELTNNDDHISTIDAFIRSANKYTAKLAAEISAGQWVTRLAEELLPTEHRTAPSSGKTPSPKRRKRAETFSVGEAIKNESLDENLPFEEGGAALTIDRFVKCCLSPPWDGDEFDGMEKVASKVDFHIVNDNTCRNETFHSPVAKRTKRHHTGLSDSLQSARSPDKEGRPLKERSNSPSLRSTAASVTDESPSQRKSQPRSRASGKGSSRDSLSSLLMTNGIAAEEASKPSSAVSSSRKTEPAASSLLGMFDGVPVEIVSQRSEQNCIRSPVASSNISEHKNGTKALPDSKNGSSQRSQRKSYFRWHDELNSPLMGLGGNLKRSSIFRAEEAKDDSEGLPFLLSSGANTGGKALLSSQELAEDTDKMEVSNSQATAIVDQAELGMATSHLGASVPVNSNGTPGCTATVGESNDRQMVTRRRAKRAAASQPGSRESKPNSCVGQNDPTSLVKANSREMKSPPADSAGENHIAKRGGVKHGARRPSLGASRRKKFVTGKWQQWEHLEFLRLMKIHGRGKWKLISESLPTRNATQVKTHAQVLMKKYDDGLDIFECLDEYERDPAAFGKPPDDHPMWTGGAMTYEPEQAGTTGSIKRRSRTYKYLPPPVVRTSWVKLVHKGHISDYHGHSRKYEHFYPLKGKSVAEAQNEIRRTIVDRVSEVESDADAEIEEEYSAFLSSVQIMDRRAKEERSRKSMEMKAKAVKRHSPSGDNIPVIFSTRMEDFEEETCKDKECRICKMDSKFDVDEFSVNAPVQLKYFDKDDEEVVDESDNDEEEGNSRRRKSRTAQIAIQKKASIMVLNEMLNTLNFIDEYNNGFQEVAGESSDDEEESEGEEGSPKKQKAKIAMMEDDEPEEETPPEEVFEPIFEPLTHSRHMANYAEMQKKNRSFYAVNQDTSIESATKKIGSLLTKSAAEIEGFFADGDIVAEEKALARGIRGYTRKADQEKMEKKEFAERQQQLERKHDYYSSTGKRKRKESPARTEWNLMGSRTLHFIGKNGRSHTGHEQCPFGPRCLVCAPILRGELPYERSAIFNPSFRRVDEDEFIVERENHERDGRDIQESDAGRRIGRGAHRESQKIASSLKLSELSHTFEFISNYNDGMIQEVKK